MTNLVHQRLGDYYLEALLGEGNIGVVYRARDLRRDTAVALKVLQPGLVNDPVFRERLRREAIAAKSLEHPNIVQIKDLGEHDGNDYIVMELITGGTLGSLFAHYAQDHSPQALWQMVDLVRQAADGLSAAHLKGVIHRDIKPANLLLSCTESQDYMLKIVDFGLARAESTEGSLSGTIVGSPAYMSPEQWKGEKADGRSDIYSLGVVLYEVCTGCVPFTPPVEGHQAAALMYQHLSEEPVPPRQLNEKLQPSLEAIILRCLKKNKEERYQTAAELSQALQAVTKEWPLDPETISSTTHKEIILPDHQKDIIVANGPIQNFIPPPASHVPVRNGIYPTIFVVDPQGNIVQETLLTTHLRIGRAADNDLVLPVEDVTAYHARLDWNREREEIAIIDLQSLNGTYLGDHRLLPNVSQNWIEDSWVRLGRTWLWIQKPSPAPLPVPDFSILVELDREFRDLKLTPGQPVVCKLTLINQGARVDEISLSIEGFPLEWIQGEERVYQVMPNNQVRAELTINVPRQSSSNAQVYEVRICAKSVAHRAAAETREARWKVLPFYASSIDIDPIKAAGRTQARYSVRLLNEGNKSTEYTLTARDDERNVDFFFTDDKHSEQSRVRVEVKPGERAVLKLKARATKHWIGNPKPCSFTVQAATADGQSSESTEAQFIHSPIFPVWLAIVAPIVLLLALWFVPDMFRPRVLSFVAGKQEYQGKEKVSLSWVLSKAKDATLLIDGQRYEPSFKDRHDFDAPEVTEEKTLLLRLQATGTFWGEDTMDLSLKIKPKPKIDKQPTGIFTVTPDTIPPGGTVNITWSISDAESVAISTIGEGLPLQGSRSETLQQNKSYTLIARNGNKQLTLQKDVIVPTPTPTPPPLPASIISFTISSDHPKRTNPMNLRKGDKITLRWNVRNAESVQLQGVPNYNDVPVKGTLKTVCVSAGGVTTYTLIARGKDGQEVSRTVTARAGCLIGVFCGCGNYQTALISN